MSVTTLTNPHNIFSILAEMRPELILMDVYMPMCDGLELAKLIRQQDAHLSIPIVFLSSETSMEKQFLAMQMGGDDFLTKPIKDEHLISSITIRAECSRALNTLMVQDGLTGLFKHTKIKEQLAIEVARANRERLQLSFVMIDIDNFKIINYTYGHMVGNRVIKSLARLLQKQLRETDSIGRYGGEEFAAILPNCKPENARKVIDRIREDFSSIHFLHEEHVFQVSISAGISDSTSYKLAADINRAADEALYAAKHAGRNCVKTAAKTATKQKVD